MGHKLRALDAMNSSGLWFTRMSLGHELKALNTINNSVVNDMSYSTSLAYDYGCYEQLRGVDDMDDSWSWAHSSKCNE